MQCA